MTDKIKIDALPDFDPAEHLQDSEDVATYLSVVLEESNPSALAEALGVVARAKGMTEIARESGLSREALYRALRAEASPRFDTVTKVLKALGLRLTITPTKMEEKIA